MSPSLTSLLIATWCVTCFFGCTSTNKDEAGTDGQDDDVYIVSFLGETKSNSELRELKRKASRGNGASAFELSAYYSIGQGQDSNKADYYFDMALELEYLYALYNKGLEEWAYNEFPNIDEVEMLIRKAIKKGHPDERRLLEEILETKRTGVFPRKSKFRLFPPFDAIEPKAEQDASRNPDKPAS